MNVARQKPNCRRRPGPATTGSQLARNSTWLAPRWCDPYGSNPDGFFPIPEMSAWGMLGELYQTGDLFDAFLGIPYKLYPELGPGTSVALFGLVFVVGPLLFARAHRRAAWVLWGNVAVQYLVWFTVPFAKAENVFHNVRYLAGAFAISYALGLSLLEARQPRGKWIPTLGLIVLAQHFLLLHAVMRQQQRVNLMFLTAAVAILCAVPTLRRAIKSHARGLVIAASLVALGCVPAWADWRRKTRAGAFERLTTTHPTLMEYRAGAVQWLDTHGGEGTVAVISHPSVKFIYPAMGPMLERDAIYINTTLKPMPAIADDPECNPRRELSPDAWIQNLQTHNVDWVWATRDWNTTEFPPEVQWAKARPDFFTPYFGDPQNWIFEFKRR